MTLVLAILLMFFNDPFFAFQIYTPNGANSFFAALVLTAFLIGLLLYWMKGMQLIADR
jgi:hypothetical protein